MRKQQTFLSVEQKKEMVARYKNGEKRAALALEYNVTLNTVARAIAEFAAGESFRSRQGCNSTLSDHQKAWAYEQYCNGYTIGEIAEALFVSYQTTYNAIAGRPRIKKPLHYDFEKEGA